MGRSRVDYNFRYVRKSCAETGGEDPYLEYPKSPYIGDAPKNCQWYSMCDLPQKRPAKAPTLPLKGKMPC